MASANSILNKFFFAFLVASFTIVPIAMAGDPDILTDFILPPNVNAADPSFFTFNGLRALVGSPAPTVFKITKATMNEFPALNGQSVSYAVLQFPGGATNPPHTHPRASELLLVVDGSLQVGLVDTSNRLYTQTLQAGDMFIFPKGLVHFQYNPDGYKTVTAVSAFGSANAGTVSIPGTLFTTGIDNTILAKAFKTDVATIQDIKKGLGGY